MVVALIALFVAMSGAAYAALEKNSVGSKQIKKNAVRKAEIKTDAVRNKEIRADAVRAEEIEQGAVGSEEISDESVASIDVEDNSLLSGDVEDNSLTTDDVQALTRADFAANELPGPVSVQRTDVLMADNTTQAAEVSCPAGQTGVAGGASVDQTGSDDIKLMVSRPGNGGFLPGDGQTFNDWRSVYRNPAGGTGASNIRAFIVCIANS